MIAARYAESGWLTNNRSQKAHGKDGTMPKTNWKTKGKKIKSIMAIPLLSGLGDAGNKERNPKDALKEILAINKEFLRIIDDKSDSISIGLSVIIQTMEMSLKNKNTDTSLQSINKSMIESTLRLLKMADRIGADVELTEVKDSIYKAAWRCNIPISDMHSRIKYEEKA